MKKVSIILNGCEFEIYKDNIKPRKVIPRLGHEFNFYISRNDDLIINYEIEEYLDLSPIPKVSKMFSYKPQ